MTTPLTGTKALYTVTHSDIGAEYPIPFPFM